MLIQIENSNPLTIQIIFRVKARVVTDPMFTIGASKRALGMTWAI